MYRKHWYMRSSSFTPSAPGIFVSDLRDTQDTFSHTIDPWVTADNGTLGQLQLGNFSLDSFILEGNILNGDNFFTIAGAMHIGTEKDVMLNTVPRKIDYRLVELVL